MPGSGNFRPALAGSAAAAAAAPAYVPSLGEAANALGEALSSAARRVPARALLPLAGRVLPGVALGIALWELYKLAKERGWFSEVVPGYGAPPGYSYVKSCTESPHSRWRAVPAGSPCQDVGPFPPGTTPFYSLQTSCNTAATPAFELMAKIWTNPVNGVHWWRARQQWVRDVSSGVQPLIRVAEVPNSVRAAPPWLWPLTRPGAWQPLPIPRPIFNPEARQRAEDLANAFPEASRVGPAAPPRRPRPVTAPPWAQPGTRPAARPGSGTHVRPGSKVVPKERDYPDIRDWDPTNLQFYPAQSAMPYGVRPWVKPYEWPAVEWGIAVTGMSVVRTWEWQRTHPMARAPARTFEQKFRAPSSPLMGYYGQITEAIDALNAIFSALPQDLRQYYGHEFSGMNPAEQAWFLWKMRGDIDWGQAALNLAGNQIEDALGGAQGNVEAQAARDLGLPVTPSWHGGLPRSFR